MSYSRLAGVGLATYYLASSFNLLSEWVSSTVSTAVPGIAGSTLAFIIGTILLLMFHIFNLFLSSLAAFIHSLRLCFVEFLLKFYEGGGTEYAPFHLRLRREVVVGKKS
jgi:V/A-type H+-transporting ATPase subunit I